jgi:hypothetical protein
MAVKKKGSSTGKMDSSSPIVQVNKSHFSQREMCAVVKLKLAAAAVLINAKCTFSRTKNGFEKSLWQKILQEVAFERSRCFFLTPLHGNLVPSKIFCVVVDQELT